MICPVCGTKFKNDSEEETEELCQVCCGKTQRIVKIECTIDTGAIGLTKQDGAVLLDQFTKVVLGRGFDIVDIDFLEKCRWREIPIKEDIKRMQEAGIIKK